MIASLATLCTEAQAAEMIGSSAWCMQAKADGKRIQVISDTERRITLLNRNGDPTTVPQGTRLPTLPPDCWFDTEFLWATRTWVGLDIIRWLGDDMMAAPLSDRYWWLDVSTARTGIPAIDAAFTLEEKAQLLLRLRMQKAEGLIFKRVNAPYSPAGSRRAAVSGSCRGASAASSL